MFLVFFKIFTKDGEPVVKPLRGSAFDRSILPGLAGPGAADNRFIAGGYFGKPGRRADAKTFPRSHEKFLLLNQKYFSIVMFVSNRSVPIFPRRGITLR